MKTMALCATFLAMGLLSAGCGSEKANQPAGVAPPAQTKAAPAAQTPTEQAPATKPAETPQQSAASPAPEKAKDSSPATEGPALTGPTAEPPAAASSGQAQPSASSSEPASGDKPAGDHKILGALGRSLLNAATGKTSGGPKQETFGDAPGFNKPN